MPLSAAGKTGADRPHRSLWLQSLSTNFCGGRKWTHFRAVGDGLSLQAIVALDGASVAGSGIRGARKLSADRSGHHPSVAEYLASFGTQLAAQLWHHFVDRRRSIIDDLACFDGFAGLSALAP